MQTTRLRRGPLRGRSTQRYKAVGTQITMVSHSCDAMRTVGACAVLTPTLRHAHRLVSLFKGGSALTRATVVCVSRRCLMTFSSSADTDTAMRAEPAASAAARRHQHVARGSGCDTRAVVRVRGSQLQ